MPIGHSKNLEGSISTKNPENTARTILKIEKVFVRERVFLTLILSLIITH